MLMQVTSMYNTLYLYVEKLSQILNTHNNVINVILK